MSESGLGMHGCVGWRGVSVRAVAPSGRMPRACVLSMVGVMALADVAGGARWGEGPGEGLGDGLRGSVSWVADDEPAVELPRPHEVIARHVEAIGGLEANLAVRSRRATGTMELPEHGLRGIFSLSSAAPDRRVVELMIPEIGAFRQGYDGVVGWSIDPLVGARVLEGRELEERVEDADFYADVRLHRPGTTIQTVGRVLFEGRSCVKLRLAEPGAAESFLFFDEGSGLLVGRVYQTTFEGVSELVTVSLDRYEPVGAVRVPMRMRIASARGVHLIELAEVEFDVVGGEVFELPPEIKGIVQTRSVSGTERPVPK